MTAEGLTEQTGVTLPPLSTIRSLFIYRAARRDGSLFPRCQRDADDDGKFPTTYRAKRLSAPLSYGFTIREFLIFVELANKSQDRIPDSCEELLEANQDYEDCKAVCQNNHRNQHVDGMLNTPPPLSPKIILWKEFHTRDEDLKMLLSVFMVISFLILWYVIVLGPEKRF